MNIFIALAIIFLFLSLYIHIKNRLVYKTRQVVLTRISKRATQAIDNREKWRHYYEILDKPSYDVLLWNPVVWTPKQMYPHINDQLK